MGGGGGCWGFGGGAKPRNRESRGENPPKAWKLNDS